MKVQVLRAGQPIVEARVLKDDADRLADQVRPHDHVVTVDDGGPRRRPQHRAEHVDRRRLARAVRPEKAEDLALMNLEFHAGDGDKLAEFANELTGFNRVHGCSWHAAR